MGEDGGAIHVHYDIFIESGLQEGYQNPKLENADLRIDPVVYWTQGLNPNATIDPYTGEATSTGLTVLLTPINDLPASLNGAGDGQIATATVSGVSASENARLVQEDQSSFLKVGVNTPHTQEIVLRLQFDQPTPGLDGLVVRGVGDTEVTWLSVGRTAYITLPATVSQSTPNTTGLIEFHFNEDDDNTRNEHYTYTVEAGYLLGGSTFVPYNQTRTVFTPVVNQSLTILDNDTPVLPEGLPVGALDPDTLERTNGDDKANVLVGTGGAERLDGFANPLEGLSPGDPRSNGYGAGFNHVDQLFGFGGSDFLYGGTGDDFLIATASLATEQVRLDDGTGRDILFGGQGEDTLTTSASDDAAGNRNDLLYGNDGADTIVAGNGDDVLLGGKGRDSLWGEAGVSGLTDNLHRPTGREVLRLRRAA